MNTRSLLSGAFLLFLGISNAQYSKNYEQLAKNGKANYYEIVKNSREEFSQNELTKKGKLTRGDKKDRKHFERWASYWKNRVYKDGTFPDSRLGYFNAGILDTNGKLTNSTNKNAVNPVEWTNVGPEQYQVNTNGYINYPQMGRLTSFLRIPHPTNIEKDVLFVGAPNGGVWKSTNGGKTWTPKTDMIAGIGVTDIATVPGTTTENYMDRPIYISTGDYDGIVVRSIGVLKSVDGGENFNSTGLTFNISDNLISGDIVVADENTVFVCIARDIAKTIDGGKTWSQAYHSPILEEEGAYLEIGRGTHLGKEIMFTDSQGHAYYTNDYTDDSNWKAYKTGFEKEGFNTSSIASDSKGNFYVQDMGGQIRTFDKKEGKFVNLGTPTTNYNSQGGYNQSLVVTDDLIISGAWDGMSSKTKGETWDLTLNGYYGDPWTEGNTKGVYVHSDHHKLGHLGGLKFWSINDGGLNYITYKSVDDVKPEEKYLTGTIKVTQSYSVSINPNADDQAYIIANQDNDAFSKQNGQWYAIRLGDGTQSAINYNNPNIRYAANQNGWLTKTDTGFEGQLDGVDGVLIPNATWDFALEIHKTDPTVLFAGADGFTKIKDNGADGIEVKEINTGVGYITSIATHGNTVMISSRENEIAISKDSGETFTLTNKPSEEFYPITSVDFDANNNNNIYVTVGSYYEGQKVFKSTDGGKTWANISGNLPNIILNEIILKQNQSEEYLFVATELGIYYTKDGGNEWLKFGSNLPNANVKDLEIHYTGDKLVAATFGRGLWEVSIPNQTLSTKNNVSEIGTKVTIFPNPTSEKLNITIKEEGKFNYSIYNVVGGVVKSGELRSKSVDVSNLAKGIYMIRIYNNNKTTTKKIIIK